MNNKTNNKMNNKNDVRLGYIIKGGEYIYGTSHRKYFEYVEYSAKERNTPGGAVLWSKRWKPFKVEVVKSNTDFMANNNAVLVRSPFYTNEETAAKMKTWCAMANEKTGSATKTLPLTELATPFTSLLKRCCQTDGGNNEQIY